VSFQLCRTSAICTLRRQWLNQIEIWFSILVRKLIRRGDFTGKNDLRTKIEAFIAYFNRTMAKPFRWTMEAKPLIC
jgi:hypothetical protein